MLVTDVIQKALVINKDGNVLLLRRSKTDIRRPLQWDLAGGMLEPDEDMIQGVEREILEESGLLVSGTRAIYSKTELRQWKSEHGDEERNVVFIFYATHCQETEVTLSFEHDKFLWVSLKEALDRIEYPLHREVFSYVLDNSVAL